MKHKVTQPGTLLAVVYGQGAYNSSTYGTEEIEADEPTEHGEATTGNGPNNPRTTSTETGQTSVDEEIVKTGQDTVGPKVEEISLAASKVPSPHVNNGLKIGQMSLGLTLVMLSIVLLYWRIRRSRRRDEYN